MPKRNINIELVKDRQKGNIVYQVEEVHSFKIFIILKSAEKWKTQWNLKKNNGMWFKGIKLPQLTF